MDKAQKREYLTSQLDEAEFNLFRVETEESVVRAQFDASPEEQRASMQTQLDNATGNIRNATVKRDTLKKSLDALGK